MRVRAGNYYRFVLSVPAKKAIKFVVKERGEESNSYSISNVSSEQIVAWYGHKFISDEVRATLERIAGWNARTAELATKDREAEAQRKLLNDNNGACACVRVRATPTFALTGARGARE